MALEYNSNKTPPPRLKPMQHRGRKRARYALERRVSIVIGGLLPTAVEENMYASAQQGSPFCLPQEFRQGFCKIPGIS